MPTGRATKLQAGGGVLYGDVDTTLDLQHAKGVHDRAPARAARLARARSSPASPRSSTTSSRSSPPTCAAARRSRCRSRCSCSSPCSASRSSCSIPFAFAACTITGTLAAVYAAAHAFTMVSYVTNLVELIGLGLAVDYSLLIVYRFREELARDDVRPTTRSCARWRPPAAPSSSPARRSRSGSRCSLFVPVPFIRSLGVGGFLVPLASIAAAATLQPALLSVFGRRGARRVPVAALLRSRLGVRVPVLPGTIDVDSGFWARLARAIMRRPVVFLAGGAAILVAAAVPAAFLQVTPGSISALPGHPESVRGLALLRADAGAGALTPTEVVVDAGAPGRARTTTPVHAAVERLSDLIFHDPEALVTATGPRGSVRRPERPLRTRDRRGPARVRRRSRRRRFVRRLRGDARPRRALPRRRARLRRRRTAAGRRLPLALVRLVPVARARRARAHVPRAPARLPLARAPAQGGACSTCSRSPPSTGCSSSSSAGASAPTCSASTACPQIEGWIPIFLFAMLFGLSMDYEVFLVTRMRESWDDVHDNARAVAHGLERTGRIVTAAAVIMVAAFSGFVAGQRRRPAGVRRRPLARRARRRDRRPRLPRARADGDPRPLQLVAAGADRAACTRAGLEGVRE